MLGELGKGTYTLLEVAIFLAFDLQPCLDFLFGGSAEDGVVVRHCDFLLSKLCLVD